MTRRGAGMLMAGAALAGALPARAADAWPSKPVHIVLAYGTGGVSDLTARLLAERLSETFGQRFLVENKPGAGGTVAAQTAQEGGPDGYWLLNVGASGPIKETLMPNLPVDQVKDFTPVAPISDFGLVIVGNPQAKQKTLAELVEWAKANPGDLNIGTVSVGSTQYLAAKLFTSVAGIEATVIPFKATPDLMGGVQRGEVDIAVEIVAGAKSAIDAKQVTLLATTMAKRSRLYPDVPTVEESGVTPYDVSSWNAYSAPKGVPQEVVSKLQDAIQAIIADPEMQEKLLGLGAEPWVGIAADVTERQDRETVQWRKVIKDAGVPIEG